MNPTIRDVARVAGVSVATASRVLSGSAYPVAPEVRLRVQEAAHTLEFTANAFARGLSRRESHLVGIVVPNISEPFFLEIARGAESVTSQHGYMVVMCNTERDPARERKYLEELRAMRSGAILVERTDYDEEITRQIRTHPAPLVAIGPHLLPCSCVRVDNIHGAMTTTQHLIELGHRRIAFIEGSASSPSALDRREGFRLAMAQNGITVDEDLLLPGDYTMAGAAAAMARLLAEKAPPDAVFAANDQMAIGAMWAAMEHGLKVPEDLSVVGFNDTPVAAFLNPPLTSFHIPLRQIGEVAARLLLDQLNGDAQLRTVTIKGKLVVRRSAIRKRGESPP